ncbi:hypothetical protein QUF75_19495 [Desulfococcaceae bacterium HSG7]|nr:hypothetical protein [Desulfococcaceae bacterium HSG7]
MKCISGRAVTGIFDTEFSIQSSAMIQISYKDAAAVFKLQGKATELLIYTSGAEWLPEFSVPSRFYPLPLLLTFMVSIILNMTGTLYTAWKTAVAPPLK